LVSHPARARADRRSAAPRAALLALAGLSFVGLALLPPTPALAIDKYAGEFLKIPVGARALGMGSAFVALADDATAVYWNPAGLVFASQRQAWAEHAEQFGDLVNHDFLAFEQPLAATGGGHAQGIAFGFLRSAVDNIAIRNKDPEDLIPDVEFEDVNGNGHWDFDPDDPEGSERLFIENIPMYMDSEAEMAFLFSYGRELGSKVAIGGTAKIIRQSLPGNSSFGIGADLGFIYSPTPTLSAGLKVSDVTTTLLAWDSGRRETIAPAVTIGGQYTRGLEALRGVVTFAGDMDMSFDNRKTASGVSFGETVLGADFHGGIEYWYERTVALRFGGMTNALTGGAGFRYHGFGIDYAFVGDHPAFDSSHRIGGSYRF
jgi:hypothetical protein